MKHTHSEFAYQSRELGIQIEDTLGDPPDRKTYTKVIKSLIDEFADGSEIDDVNLLSFALVDFLRFTDIAGLLAQSANYDHGDIVKVLGMVTCSDETAQKALVTVAVSNPDLARRAVITAFLFKNPKRWSDEDQSLDSLQKSESGDDEEEDHQMLAHDVEGLFDANGDK
jgi:hypothetical protein